MHRMRRFVFLAVLSFMLSIHAGAEVKPETGKHYTIYLLAGQSNMDGRGKTRDLTGKLAAYAEPLDTVLIRYASGGHKRKLRESGGLIHLQPGCNENAGQFGPELGFGHAMAKARPQQNILLIKVSEGGTNLHSDWSPESEKSLYHRLIQVIGETRAHLTEHGATHEIAGMIWHQGESDSGRADAYADLLTAFMGRIRQDLELPKLPFVIGELCVDNPGYQNLIAAQKQVAKDVPGVGFASSKGLTTHDRNVHFDFGSLIEFGERFAKELDGMR